MIMSFLSNLGYKSFFFQFKAACNLHRSAIGVEFDGWLLMVDQGYQGCSGAVLTFALPCLSRSRCWRRPTMCTCWCTRPENRPPTGTPSTQGESWFTGKCSTKLQGVSQPILIHLTVWNQGRLQDFDKGGQRYYLEAAFRSMKGRLKKTLPGSGRISVSKKNRQDK